MVRGAAVAAAAGLVGGLLAGLLAGCSTGDGTDTAALDSSPTTSSTAAVGAGTAGSTASSTASATTGSTGSATAGATASPTTGGGTRAAGRKVALFFGDSDFVGGGCTPDRHQDEAQIAADRLGYRAVIRGAGGTGYASANPEFGLASYLSQIHAGVLDLSATPSLVVIEGGANDIGRNIDKITRNAERVLQIARSKHPDALMAMVGPMAVRGNFGETDPIVGALAYAAGQEGVPFIDAEAWIPANDTTLLCSDYDHPTLKGHRLIGRKLAHALRSLGA